MSSHFTSQLFKIIGRDNENIPGMLKKSLSLISQLGWADSRKALYRIDARVYKHALSGQENPSLQSTMYLTPDNHLFSYICDGSGKPQKVGKLIYHRKLTDKEKAELGVEEPKPIALANLLDQALADAEEDLRIQLELEERLEQL
jgi:hypothetical protein